MDNLQHLRPGHWPQQNNNTLRLRKNALPLSLCVINSTSIYMEKSTSLYIVITGHLKQSSKNPCWQHPSDYRGCYWGYRDTRYTCSTNQARICTSQTFSRERLRRAWHSQMQTPASVYAMGLAPQDFEQVSHSSCINISTKTMETIKTHSAKDTLLQQLHACIKTGWPNYKCALNSLLRPFWTFKEELASDSGLIFKGQRILIPKALRPVFLEKNPHWTLWNWG